MNQNDTSQEWDLAAEEKKKVKEALAKLLNVIAESFEPATENNFSHHYTTQKIYEQLQDVFPCDRYSVEDVYHQLITLGFKLTLIGSGIQYEWLLRRKQIV